MRDRIIRLIKENYPEIDDIENINFVYDGIFDSFDIVTLVSALDKAFEVSIDGVMITPENFNTVNDIVRLVEETKNAV